MPFVLTILAVLIVLVANEIWYRKKALHDEFSRKFIHITVGSFVAFWPFFLSWEQIQILSLAFLIAIGISKAFNIFQAIHSVQRPTWGEVYFAVAVGLIALFTEEKWVYTAALLQMSLADGLAAVIGTKYGRRHKYLVFGHPKSLIGTATFFIVSFAVLVSLNSFFPTELGLLTILGISLVATFLENIFVMGLDNLLVPLFVALVLTKA